MSYKEQVKALLDEARESLAWDTRSEFYCFVIGVLLCGEITDLQYRVIRQQLSNLKTYDGTLKQGGEDVRV